MPTLEQAGAAVETAIRELQQGRPAAAAARLTAVLAAGAWPDDVANVLVHNLSAALRHAAEERLAANDPDAARALVTRALALPPPENAPPEMPRHRAEFFHGLGLACFRHSLFPEALACQRRAIALYPCPSFSNNLVNTLAVLKQPAVLTDYADALSPAEVQPHLLIACQPKSGSTFLKNLLCRITGFRDLYFFHASAQNEQDLFFPTLLEFATVPTVTQQHCRASEANLQLLQAFAMPALVLTRNLADVIISLRDFLTSGAVHGTFFDPQTWAALTPEQRIDRIIDHLVPWHLQFLASWQRAGRERRIAIHWLGYDALVADPTAAARAALAFFGIGAPEDSIRQAVDAVTANPAANRFNVGRTGRGADLLTAAQHQRLRTLADAYPETDFTPYGL
jgi:tetratricopeptide (TPR) repeat protein